MGKTDFGNLLTAETFPSGLFKLFQTISSTEQSLLVVDRLFKRLVELEIALRSVEADWRFYSSSILFIVESDPSCPSPLCDLRMIDFAHSYIGSAEVSKQGPDSGYLKALCILRNIVESYKTRW